VNEPAFDELLRALVEAGARFVLVGGFAVNAWGVVRLRSERAIVVRLSFGALVEALEAARKQPA